MTNYDMIKIGKQNFQEKIKLGEFVGGEGEENQGEENTDIGKLTLKKKKNKCC